jgi:hypothetical protein
MFTNPAEALVNNATNSAANASLNIIKRMFNEALNILLHGLAVFSDPLFRKDLGERYLNPIALLGVLGLFLISGVLTWYLGTALTAFALLYFGFLDSAGTALGNNHILCAITFFGYGISLFGAIYCDRRAAIMRHIERQPTHSYSLGEPRLKRPEEIRIEIGLFVYFLITAAPLAAVFLASLVASFMQEKNQEAVIYNRYLDVVDATIENDQLETAMIGISPVKNTHLYKQLPTDLPDHLRKSIAAANAKNTVRGVTQAPRAMALAPAAPTKTVAAVSPPAATT